MENPTISEKLNLSEPENMLIDIEKEIKNCEEQALDIMEMHSYWSAMRRKTCIKLQDIADDYTAKRKRYSFVKNASFVGGITVATAGAVLASASSIAATSVSLIACGAIALSFSQAAITEEKKHNKEFLASIENFFQDDYVEMLALLELVKEYAEFLKIIMSKIENFAKIENIELKQNQEILPSFRKVLHELRNNNKNNDLADILSAAHTKYNAISDALLTHIKSLDFESVQVELKALKHQIESKQTSLFKHSTNGTNKYINTKKMKSKEQSSDESGFVFVESEHTCHNSPSLSANEKEIETVPITFDDQSNLAIAFSNPSTESCITEWVKFKILKLKRQLNMMLEMVNEIDALLPKSDI